MCGCVLVSQGIDAGAWQLPIFLCEELQSPNILPVFLSPQDLAATWEKSGRTKEELPEGITMMDLRMLVAQVRGGQGLGQGPGVRGRGSCPGFRSGRGFRS
jgi:hypothetical protein